MRSNDSALNQILWRFRKKSRIDEVLAKHRKSLRSYIADNYEGAALEAPELEEQEEDEPGFDGGMVSEMEEQEEDAPVFDGGMVSEIEGADKDIAPAPGPAMQSPAMAPVPKSARPHGTPHAAAPKEAAPCETAAPEFLAARKKPAMYSKPAAGAMAFDEDDYEDRLKRELDERMKHLSDTFTEYLLYLIEQQGMTNAEVWNRACIDKKVFSKIKNNVNYHPQKRTALQLCVGAKLNLDNTKDLLARAGYALSPSDIQDVIFSYFIEKEIFDILEIDIMLEEYGLPCIIE